MRMHPRWLTVLGCSLAILAARPATAALVLKAKSIFCGGSGPQEGRMTVTEKDAVVTLKFKAKDLTPGFTVQCGFFCNAVGMGGVELPCGTIEESGRWSHTLEQPEIQCWGFIPFFNTGPTGVCVPGTIP